MNTIKQAKHATDTILGKYGVFRTWRSGASPDGTYTWTAEAIVNSKAYSGWGNTEEEARTNLANNFKEKKWEYDNSHNVITRRDDSRLTSTIQLGDNDWWRITQTTRTDVALIEKDAKNKTFVVQMGLPEPIKNILVLTEIFKAVNEKMGDSGLKMSPEQIKEYARRVYPILSYSGLWTDHITADELDEFYEVQNSRHYEKPTSSWCK